MNMGDALRAAGIGLVAVATFIGALLLFFFASLTGAGLLGPTIGPSGWSFGDMAPWAKVVWFTLVPGLLILGGALPARALAASWLRSFLASTVVLGPCYGVVLQLAVQNANLDESVVLPIVLTLAPAFVILAARANDGLTRNAVLLGVTIALVIVTLTLFFRVSAVISLLVTLFAWIALPAVTGLFLPPDTEGGEAND